MRHLFMIPLLVLVACGSEYSPPDEMTADEIISGRKDNRHVAVGQIGSDWPPSWHCTGTLIAPNIVLTAAHCLYDEDNHRVPAARLLWGEDDAIYDVVSANTQRYSPGSRDAWNDIAILTLSEPSRTTPIPIATTVPRVDQRVTVVGFGVTRATGPHRGTGGGVRRSATITLDEVGAREVAYASDEHGACYGDSGGPLLARIGGKEQVVGVTSRGTAVDCLDVDIATRVDAYATWIGRFLP